MKSIRRFFTITLILISTFVIPSVFAADDFFDITVYEVNTPTHSVTGSGVLSTNRTSNIKIEWNTAETGAGFTNYVVQMDFGTGWTDLNSSKITSNSWTIQDSALPSIEGDYPIRVEAYDAGDTLGNRSVVTILRIDTTAPGVVTNLEIKDPNNSDNIITNLEKNVGEVKLTWDAPADTDLLAQPYRVYYVLPNRNPVDITDISNVTGETAASIDISADGLGIFDTDVTFQVSVVDVAYNESLIAEAEFTLDTKTADNVTDLIMEDGSYDIPFEGVRNNITNLEWDEPSSGDVDFYQVYYKIGDGTWHSTGAPIPKGTEYYDLGTLDIFDTDDLFYFKVTSIDNAKNESSGTTTRFYLDTVQPVAVVSYTDIDTSNSTNIEGESVNFVEKMSIEVVNAANDIHEFSVTTSASPSFVSGDRTDLQAFLRALQIDGDYTITIKDEAGNTNSYTFTLDQQFPALPTNTSLTVTSLDLEDRIGVQSNVTITWHKSTDPKLDHYEVYVNGELIANDITNSGVTEQTIEYHLTLDTIKYGDVENFYEVRTYDANGNYGTYKIRKHITEDLVKPTAAILYTQSFEEEIGFTVELLDYNRVIDEVYAVLYEGGQFVKSMPISTGINSYIFEDLDDNQSDYQIKIEADFHYDSVSYNNEVINLDTIYNLDTLSSSRDVIAVIGPLDITEESVEFELTTTKETTADETVDIKLYQGATLVDTIRVDLDTNDLVSVRNVWFEGIATGQDFQIRIVDSTDVIATANFFTQKDIPSVAFELGEIEGNAINLKVVLSDDDGAIDIGADDRVLRVYKDGVMVQEINALAVGTNNITVTDLEFFTEYEFRVFTSYDIQNGRGKIVGDEIGTIDATTAKDLSTIEIRDIKVTESSIIFDIDVDDVYQSNKVVKAVLYQGATPTGDEILLDNNGYQRNIEFDGLDSLTNYRVNILVTYDLEDGNGRITNTLYTGQNATTLKSIPSIEVSNIVITNTTLTIDAAIIDSNDSYQAGFIKIYELGKSVPVDMYSFAGTGVKTFEFEGLKQDTIYRIKVDADIDLNDGEGVFDEIIYDKEIKTHKNIGIDIISISEGYSVIEFKANVYNYLNETIYAKIYHEGSLVGDAIPVLAGENEIQFIDLNPDTIYTIKLEYAGGDQTLWTYQTITERIIELQTPTIEITDQNVEGDVLTVKVKVEDPDNALTSDIVQIRICNEIGLCTIQEIKMNILASGIELPLPYEFNTVQFSVEYDNLKVRGEVKDETGQIQVVEPDNPDPTDPTDPVDPEPVDPVEPEPQGFFARIWNWFISLFRR